MIGKKIAETGITQVLTLFLGVVTGVFITRMLGPEGRGVYAIYRSNIDLFLLVFTFGMGSSIVYFSSVKKLNIKVIYGACLVSFFVGILLFIAFILYVSEFHLEIKNLIFPSPYSTKPFILYLFFSFAIGFINLLLTSVLNGRKHFSSINIVKLLQAVILLLLILAAFFLIETGSLEERILVVFYLTMISLIFSFFLLFWYLRKKLRFNWKITLPGKGQFRLMIGMVSLVYLGEVLNFFNYRLDIWLVEYFENTRELGFYSLAVGVSQLLWLIPTAFSLVLLPYLNSLKDNLEEARNVLRFYSRVVFTSTLLICILLFWMGEWFIPLLYGSDFKQSVTPFQWLLPGILFSSLTKIFSVFIVTQGKIRLNIIAVVCGLIVTIFLDIYLIPILGIVGASIATSISYITIFVVGFLVLIRTLPTREYNYFFVDKADVQLIIKRLLKYE